MVLHARVACGRRQPPQRVLRQPAVDALVHRRMIEQPQMVDPPDVASMLGRERDPPAAALPRGAVVGDEEIAHRAAGTTWAGGERRRDEAVRGRIEERALPAAVAQELIRIAVAPVVLQAAAKAQVLDARA